MLPSRRIAPLAGRHLVGPGSRAIPRPILGNGPIAAAPYRSILSRTRPSTALLRCHARLFATQNTETSSGDKPATTTPTDSESKAGGEDSGKREEDEYSWWEGSKKYNEEQKRKEQEGFLRTSRGKKIFAAVTGLTLVGGYSFHMWIEDMHSEQQKEFEQIKENLRKNQTPGIEVSELPDSLPHPYEVMGEMFTGVWTDLWKHYTSDEPTKLLPDAIPAPNGYVPYTLVLDLEETLIHTENSLTEGVRTALRPGLYQFLSRMVKSYEVVIFSSSDQRTVEDVVFQLDPNGEFISHRIYRSGMVKDPETGKLVKDLSRINRDLSRVVIVDDNPDHFEKQPNNGITISTWTDDPDDVELIKLIPFLEFLVHRNTDVRNEIGKFAGRYIPAAFAEQGQKRLAEVKKKTENSGIKGLFSILTDNVTGGNKQ